MLNPYVSHFIRTETEFSERLCEKIKIGIGYEKRDKLTLLFRRASARCLAASSVIVLNIRVILLSFCLKK